jgi:predicted nucleotidyltransferase
MIGKEKVAYTPSQNKFFEISKDPISQERKKVLMECFRDLNKLFPGLDIGFSLFGSLSKGKLLDTPGIAESSDIDLLVLFSKEKLQVYFFAFLLLFFPFHFFLINFCFFHSLH